MKHKKIIFVNRYFYPDISATSQSLSDLAFGLKDMDAEIHVVTSRLRYDSSNGTMPAEETVKNVQVHRVWTSHFGRNYLPGRAVDYLTFYLSAAFKLLAVAGKNDIVVAKTDPPLISVVCAVVCLLKGAKLVNWLQDLFPEVAKELGVKLPGFIYVTLKKLRDWSLGRAMTNVVIGEIMAERISQIGIRKENIRLIQNWANAKKIWPVEYAANRFRKEWGLQDKFVIAYSGNMGRSHDFSGIIKAARQLKAVPDIVFLFIGDGAQKGEIEKTARAEQLNMLFRPYQPIENLPESISVANVHLASLKPEVEGLIVPSKFYGIIAAARICIFIGDSDGEIPRVLREYNIGYTTSNDGDDLAPLILSLYKDEQDTEQMATRAYQYFREQGSLDIALARWISLFS